MPPSFKHSAIISELNKIYPQKSTLVTSIMESKEEIKATVIGINHFTWLKDAFYKNIDLYPLYRDYCKENIETGEKEQIDTINTKINKNANTILDKFNKGKINHITACNILNEGCNLTDCKYGVFVAINSSEVMVTQKIGRILRHKNPVIIIPYYIHTREEELVDKILETVSDDNVIVLKDFKKDGIQD